MSVLLLVLLLLLIAINGFFVAAEFALVRIAPRQGSSSCAEEGERGAEAVVEQLDKIDESLSACQIGITIASIGIGFLGEPSLADAARTDLRRPLARRRGRRSRWRSPSSSSPSLHIILGEQSPKMLAIADAERTACRVARPLQLVPASSTAPLIVATERARQRGRARCFGVNPDDVEETTPPRSCKQIIDARGARRPPRPRRGGACSAASSTCTSRRRAR